MGITTAYINALLVAEDIEGFIAFGAPKDEYSHEAAMIADAIKKLDRTQFTEENITAIIVLAWSTFELSPEELALRAPYIRNVVARILQKEI